MQSAHNNKHNNDNFHIQTRWQVYQTEIDMKVTLITGTGVCPAPLLQESVKLSITQSMIWIMEFSSHRLDNSRKIGEHSNWKRKALPLFYSDIVAQMKPCRLPCQVNLPDSHPYEVAGTGVPTANSALPSWPERQVGRVSQARPNGGLLWGDLAMGVSTGVESGFTARSSYSYISNKD